MTTPLWCLVVTAFFPLLIAISTGLIKVRTFGKLDNNNPRQQNAELTGVGARAVAAQSNAWEATAMFTVAVVVNHLAGGPAGPAATAAIVFLVARVLHAAFYVGDQAVLRSLAFFVALGSCVALIVQAA